MPSFTFDGLTEVFYPETRDSHGAHLGAVQPGEIRDLDEAPDSLLWHETTEEEKAAAAKADEPANDSSPDDGGTEDASGSAEAGTTEGDAPASGSEPDPDEHAAF